MRYLETSLEKLARILSRQYNVEVLFEGEQAFTNGQKIVLPFFQNLTEELEKDLNGYLDHEVAHVKFTQFPEVRQVISAYHKEMLNAAEDIRIERLMMQEFPGTEYHLVPLRAKLNAKIDKNWFTRPWPIRFLIALMRVMDGNKPFPKDAEIEKHLDSCKSEIAQLNSCKNTREIRTVTESIVRKLIKEREEEKEQDKKQKEEQSQSEKENNQNLQEKNSSEQNSSSQNQDGEKQKQTQDKKEEKSDKKSQKSKNGKSEKTESEKKESDDSLLTEKKEEKFEQFEIDVHRMINSMIEKQTEKEKQEVKATKYDYEYKSGSSLSSIPLTTRFDIENNFVGKDNNRLKYSEVRRQVKPMVNTLKSNLEKIFKSVENARWKSEREQGLLNSRSLSQMASNPNYRTVFKELSKNETDKVAISIVVDLSGSMSGDKIHTAKLAASAMGEALSGLGMNFEVIGFRTGYNEAANRYAHETGIKDFSRFNRTTEVLEHHVFKSFDSSSLLGLSQIESGGSNNDGESILWAAKRLAVRPEKRKIMIVMSDGMPAGQGNPLILQSDLRIKLAQIEKFGIETVGFGILTDHVKHFYKDFVVINKLQDLTSSCLKKLSGILTKNLPLRK
jgi:cobaltochelatase CobT